MDDRTGCNTECGPSGQHKKLQQAIYSPEKVWLEDLSLRYKEINLKPTMHALKFVQLWIYVHVHSTTAFSIRTKFLIPIEFL